VVPRVLSGSTTQAGAAMATFVMTPGMLGGGVPSPAAAAPGALGVLVIALGLATGMVYVIQMDLPFPVIDPSTGLPANATPGAGGLTGASSGVRGSGAAGGGGGGGGGGLGAASYATQPSKPISVVKLSARPEAGHAWAVTGLALHGADLDNLAMFVVTESQTLSFSLRTHVKVCARVGSRCLRGHLRICARDSYHAVGWPSTGMACSPLCANQCLCCVIEHCFPFER
jgi:hypothetical protein